MQGYDISVLPFFTHLSLKHGSIKHYMERKLLTREFKISALFTLLEGWEKYSFLEIFH